MSPTDTPDPPDEAPMPLDPEDQPHPKEAPPPMDPAVRPVPPEAPEPSEDPGTDPFDDGNFPV
ncbi:hypothetical protein [Sulfitobacter sp. S190]|uniref:hypothetical protein n=1 Tax=Sulfitobacter sp. S190 TaxID=2867022 RepID=UPI0021A4079E|nr:hypothetical protein [Sulfitobacter sp. S190]UWR21847.1 hypothetical protein K3756_14325 [Sulfitobacter sp. S190]